MKEWQIHGIFNQNIKKKYRLRDKKEVINKLLKEDVFVLNRFFSEVSVQELFDLVLESEISWADLKRLYQKSAVKDRRLDFLFFEILGEV